MALARFARRSLKTTELFARGVGEETDIVSKEMYTWEDRGAGAEREGAEPDTAAGEYRRRGARVHRARAGRDAAMLQKLYLHRAAVPAGAAADGAGTGSSGRSARRCSGRRGRARRARCAMPRCWRCWRRFLNELGVRVEAGDQLGWLVEDRPRYIAALREALEPVKATDVRGLSAAGGDESAARAGLQGAGRPGDHRRAAADRRLSG